MPSPDAADLDAAADALARRLLASAPADRPRSRADIDRLPVPVARLLHVRLDAHTDAAAGRPPSPWVNDDEGVREADRALRLAYRTAGQYPPAEWDAAVTTASRLALTHLTHPAETLAAYAFAGEPGHLPAGSAVSRLWAFAPYPYLPEIAARYVEKKGVDRLDQAATERLLRRIDRRMVETFSTADWLHLLRPLYDLLGGDVVPVPLLRALFEAKGHTDLAALFDGPEDVAFDRLRDRLADHLGEPAPAPEPSVAAPSPSASGDVEGMARDSVRDESAGDVPIGESSGDEEVVTVELETDEAVAGEPASAEAEPAPPASAPSEPHHERPDPPAPGATEVQASPPPAAPEPDAWSEPAAAPASRPASRPFVEVFPVEPNALEGGVPSSEPSEPIRSAEDSSGPNPGSPQVSSPTPATDSSDEPLWKTLVRQAERTAGALPRTPPPPAPPASPTAAPPTPAPPDPPAEAPSAGDEPLWRRFAVPAPPSPAPATEEAVAPASLEEVEARVLGPGAAERREWYVAELFGGSRDDYRQTLDRLLRASTWTAATEIIGRDVFRKHKVNIYTEAAVAFTDAVESRIEIRP